ncbi:MAG: ATP-dependent DNA helicase [Methanomassiliicoccales archaeon]|nr:ATP-dependent DNA helicase [Methanomassiliicoccales archaeon]
MESSTAVPASGSEEPSVDLFPHPIVRPGQDLFLEDARVCLANGTHLLAHAPMGLGKTAVSLAAGLESSPPSGSKLRFLTARQSQHTVAVETLRLIWRKRHFACVDIISRQDMCLALRKGWPSCIAKGSCFFLNRHVEEAAERLLEYPLHVQEAMRLCLRLGACPYLAAQKAAKAADVIVGDYNQLFTERASESIGKDELAIIDEGHNLPNRIADSNSSSLTSVVVERAISSPAMRPFREDLEVLEHEMKRLTSGKGRAKIEPWELDEALAQSCGADSGSIGEEVRSALSALELERHRALVEFLCNWSAFGNSSVRYSEPFPARLVCRLVDPSLIAGPVFARLKGSIVMSGTLHPPEMFAELLGLEGRCATREYRSPFPPENRIVLAAGDVSSRYRTRGEQTNEAMAERVRRICAAVPGNVAAFFPSYDFLAGIALHLRRKETGKRILEESRELTKNERDAMLVDLSREGDALLLATIGGSFSEGIDFRDNLLSAVIVAGFPLGPPSLENDLLRTHFAQKFGAKKAVLYSRTYPAISKVLQAAGRAIRSETDRAAIVLLDDRYLLPSVRDCFPEDSRPIAPQDLDAALAAFYSPAPPPGDERVI